MERTNRQITTTHRHHVNQETTILVLNASRGLSHLTNSQVIINLIADKISSFTYTQFIMSVILHNLAHYNFKWGSRNTYKVYNLKFWMIVIGDGTMLCS